MLLEASSARPPPASTFSREGSCSHCGAPLCGEAALQSGFCCSGCAYVHRLIAEEGLDGYYRIRDPLTPPADPAVFEMRDFGWLADAQVQAEDAAAGSAGELTVGVQGVSCAACVWLIERVSQRQKGVCGTVVNAGRGTIHLRWAPGQFDSREWARRLQSFGYIVGPQDAAEGSPESTGLVRRIGLCAAFALNVMLFTLPAYFGMASDFEFAGLFRLLSVVFATLSVMAGGMYFVGRAVRALGMGTVSIDLPVAIGIVGSFAATVYGWLFGQGRFLYPDFVATFILLMLIGRWAQISAVERNRRRLLRLQPAAARLELVGGGELDREALVPGLEILVASGQVAPVDCRLEDGVAAFSLASISGEAQPRVFRAWQRIPGGALNVERRPVRLRTLERWGDSLLSRLLERPQRPGGQGDRLERVIQGYVLGIIAVATLSGAGWWLATGSGVRAASVAVAVLVVSCPCAIGLAVPLVDEIATASLARRGVFVRDADLWSRLRRVRKVIFDKTGTLTLDTPVLLNPETLAGISGEARRALAGLVRGDLHPVSRCLNECLLAAGPASALEGRVDETVGAGVSIGPWSLGRQGWRDAGPPGPATVLACDGRVVAVFHFSDAARPDAAQELDCLRKMGLATFILSGDSQGRVASLAKQLGVEAERALGGLSPEQKAAWIDVHARNDALMLGDGANDSLAFDRALCRGTPVVHRGILEGKCDFYYLRRGIGGIRDLFATDRTRRLTRGWVVGFSLAYNITTAAIAVSGWINPLVAAVLMPASSLVSLAIAMAGMGRCARRIS